MSEVLQIRMHSMILLIVYNGIKIFTARSPLTSWLDAMSISASCRLISRYLVLKETPPGPDQPSVPAPGPVAPLYRAPVSSVRVLPARVRGGGRGAALLIDKRPSGAEPDPPGSRCPRSSQLYWIADTVPEQRFWAPSPRALRGVGNPWGLRFPTGNGWKWVNFQGNLQGGAVTGASKGLITFLNF